MARPISNGSLYFPLDTDIFSDNKIKSLKANYGADGFTLYIYLICQIYKEHYYIQITEELIDVFSYDLNMSAKKISQMISFLLKRSLFDNKLFKSDKVLSSAGIQRRYCEMVKKKGEYRTITVEKKFWLLSKDDTPGFIKFAHFEGFGEENGGFRRENEGFGEENPCKINKNKKNKNKIIKKESIKEKSPVGSIDNKQEVKCETSFDAILSSCEYLMTDELKEAYYDFIKMRKLTKEPLTDRALRRIINKTNELAPKDEKLQIKILEQSIVNNWKDVYEIKTYKKPTVEDIYGTFD